MKNKREREYFKQKLLPHVRAAIGMLQDAKGALENDKDIDLFLSFKSVESELNKITNILHYE